MSHAWSYGESSLDKWPIIDSNKSKAYPGRWMQSLWIWFWSWRWKVIGDCVVEGSISGTPNSASYFLRASLSSTRAVHFIPKNMHGAGYVSNWTVSPMTWVILRTGSLDWIKRWVKRGGESIEYQENQDNGNWVSSILGVAIDDKWWMMDDGLSMVGLAVMRLWVIAKVKGVWHWWN